MLHPLCFLSKRWQFLWMMVPKLVYDYNYHYTRYGRYWRFDYICFSTFVDRSLFRHEAPVIETLHFKLGQICGSGNIGVWTRDVDKRCVRELIIEIDTFPCSTYKTPVTLPRSLYTNCRMLVTLELSNAVLLDDASPISFSFLKKLSLLFIKYPSEVFVQRLLSGCPVLEDLSVAQCPEDNVTILRIRVPSLKNLFLHGSERVDKENLHSYVIDAPSLECLRITDHSLVYCLIENNMPKIVKATFNVTYMIPWKVLGYVTTVKSLDLCFSISKNVYPVGSVFHGLLHLRVCTCEAEWLNLLLCLLRDSPKLQSLKLDRYQCHRPSVLRPCWSEPSSVPGCLLSSLETLKWVKYEGAKEEKEVAAFILRNANCLKKATIISSKYIHRYKKLEMLKELALSPRCSRTCQLLFD